MSSKVNIFSNEWCRIVFENRNRDYGAYPMRTSASRRHLIALIIAIVIFSVGSTAPVIIRRMAPERKERDISVRVLTDIKLDKPIEKVNEIIAEMPPPPPLKNVIKFTAPVIKPDEEVSDEEEPKTQQEVTESKAAVGTIDYDKGTDAPEAEMPETMPVEDQQIVGEGTMEPYTFVEQMPDFPGGETALHKYLVENVKYPQIAKENDVQGTVYVTFIVDKNGEISDIKVLRGIGAGCDEEAIRVIANMPMWNPGKQNGMAVPVRFNMPIKFQLI